MKTRFPMLALVVVPGLLVAGTGCGQIRARMAFKDGNKLYKEENYKQAILEYQKATAIEPEMSEAWFYLGSSHQALFRPGKDSPDNREHLEKAIEYYKKAIETNKGNTEGLKKVRANALGALTAIHTEEPFKDFDAAQKYANELVQANPNDAKNLYAMANLYEKFGKIDQAEETYKKVVETNPQDPKACGALAAFYNKPLWDGRSRFDQAIDILQRCAMLTPNEPGGYQKVATFYWDKAYRDPMLNDAQKDDYADKGLEAVDKALAIKPDHFEAIIFKGLLFRVKAQVAKSPQLRAQYLDQAATLQKQGLELKKEQAESAASASPSPSAPGS
jgi:tetratricopeptide (TPR) repeat protein